MDRRITLKEIDENTHYVVSIRVQKVVKVRDGLGGPKPERSVTEMSNFTVSKTTLKGAINFGRGHLDLLSSHLEETSDIAPVDSPKPPVMRG